ncbi:MAG: hypothetical protein LBC68_05790, partial [Prevotellaceae bacterium]|nr:hypothetical protein [Prevotellaceae bacterium]
GTNNRTDYIVEDNEWIIDDESETIVDLLEYLYDETNNQNSTTSSTIPSDYSCVSIASTLYAAFANYFSLYGFLTLSDEERQSDIDSRTPASNTNNQQTTSLTQFQQTNNSLYQKFQEIYGTEGVKKLENILNAGWTITIFPMLRSADYTIDKDKKKITVSSKVALNINIGDLGQQRYKAWRLMAALDEVSDINNEIVQWQVKRNNNQTQATAVPANGQTIVDLANLIGLDASAWQSWLFHAPNSTVKIINSNGTISEINFSQLTLEHKLSSENTFKVPNVILVLYAGHAGGLGKVMMQWTSEITYIKEAGFCVKEIKTNGDPADKLAFAVKRDVRSYSISKELQGIYIGWCHGSPAEANNDTTKCTMTMIPDKSQVTYSELGTLLTYKLGFVVIKACYSEVGKSFLLSSSLGARSWFTNADRVLDPAFPFGAPYVWIGDTLNALKEYRREPEKKPPMLTLQLTQSAPSIIVSALPPGALGTDSQSMIKFMPGTHFKSKIIKKLRLPINPETE